MKKKLSLIVWAALAALVSSCHKESDERIVWSNNEVRFSTQILSRAVNGQWESGDEVGVYMFSSSTNTVLDKSSNNKYFVSTDGNLTPATEMDKLYYPLKEAVDFIAYYPFGNVENYTVNIDVSNQTRPEEIDFLYSNNVTGVAATNETQLLQFNHLMSKLNFTIQAGTGVNAADLQGLTLKICNAVSEGAVSLKDGNVVLGTKKKEIATRTLSSTESMVQTEAIVIPQGCDGVMIVVTLVSGENFIFPLTGGYDWLSGKKYLYEISLTDQEVDSSLKAEIKEWEDGESGGTTDMVAAAWDGETIDTDWYAEENNVFMIFKPSELAGLADLVNNGHSFEGKTIQLLWDLDMADMPFTPIGLTANNSFKGTFVGNNHLIKNLNPIMAETSDVVGLFGLSYGTIQTLMVDGEYNMEHNSVNTYSVGGICAVNKGVITHCRSYVEMNVKQMKAGTGTNLYVGGIVGQNINVVSSCQNYGAISAENVNTTSDAHVHVGGIAGSNTGILTQCENTRNVTGRNGNVRIGGIVALSTKDNDSETPGTVTNCSNIGDISITASHNEAIAGGVVGKNASGATVTAAYNKGDIEASLESGLKICGGGIIGMNDAGYLLSGENNGDVTISGATNGEVDCMAAAGGGAGYHTNGAEVHQVINSGTMVATLADVCYSGGITGYNDTVENQVAYTYACGSNSGYPLQWVGNATDQDDLVTEEEAGAHDNE